MAKFWHLPKLKSLVKIEHLLFVQTSEPTWAIFYSIGQSFNVVIGQKWTKYLAICPIWSHWLRRSKSIDYCWSCFYFWQDLYGPFSHDISLRRFDLSIKSFPLNLVCVEWTESEKSYLTSLSQYHNTAGLLSSTHVKVEIKQNFILFQRIFGKTSCSQPYCDTKH